MRELVVDLHLHSRFSRAVSQRMNLSNMYLWGRKKGINILSIADFTHPIWYRETLGQLTEIQEGIFALKDDSDIKEQLPQTSNFQFLGPYFMLSCEVSLIYSEAGKTHRLHCLIFAPNFSVAGLINKEFTRRGFNLLSDGRPTFGITAKQLMELLLSIDRHIAVIPCHIWTPWFSLYGSRSGYDSITDCFGEYAKYIFAIETGLSSDPSMNWRIPELETRSIVSFSDAHSLEKMGREATVLQSRIQNSELRIEDITYKNILNSFVRGRERVFQIGYTIEFYPEEGKYHYTGHRVCGVSYPPATTPPNAICPVCNKLLTVGVMQRVDDLAKKPENNFTFEKDVYGVAWVKDKENKRPPSVSLVPLLEILAESLEATSSSQKVMNVFDQLIAACGTEHEVLLRTTKAKLREIAGEKVADGILKVRKRAIAIEPGYDNEYGKVTIWLEGEEKDEDNEQLGLGI